VEGRNATKRLVQACIDLQIECLSIYTFSTENWKRSDDEVSGLMVLIEKALATEIAELNESDVRFVASGRLHELPETLQATIAEGEEATAGNSGLCLNMAVNYSGRAEILDACRQLAHDAVLGRIRPDEIRQDAFGSKLYRPELPDVDLFIRPGGEMRVSNFLLWQIAYAEIYVMPVLWPDFRKDHLEEAIEAYRRRDRRFGGVPQL
jgi:undecaprenyl diphosphate synthase